MGDIRTKRTNEDAVVNIVISSRVATSTDFEAWKRKWRGREGLVSRARERVRSACIFKVSSSRKRR